MYQLGSAKILCKDEIIKPESNAVMPGLCLQKQVLMDAIVATIDTLYECRDRTDAYKTEKCEGERPLQYS